MVGKSSFTIYVKDRFYNDMFDSIKDFVFNNQDKLDLQFYKVRKVEQACLHDIYIRSVFVYDRPEMQIAFTVILETDITVRESDYHFDETEDCTQWFSLDCSGNLESDLNDFKIHSIDVYNGKRKQFDPLSDSLVPYIRKEDLENEARQFLEDNDYRDALKIPMAIEPQVLAKKMGLTLEFRNITKDLSTFGEIFFSDCDVEFYDAKQDAMVPEHVEGKTIVVDPKAFLLRNLGAVNNTIVHECVHWHKHRKAFELERLFNGKVSQIKCQVVGGIRDNERNATDWMEWQANSLAPRIQMPYMPFKIKAAELVKKYRSELKIFELVDVMEPVIEELSIFFCVSRTAAKIRMVEIGYEEAIGTFTFVDGHYVRTHTFKKGVLERTQTYTIGFQDAMIQSLTNPMLREKAQEGAYIFVESHLCLNNKKYITYTLDGKMKLTEYARLHVHECCVAFDLSVKSVNKYGEKYYTECVLFRDADSGLEFQAIFSEDKNISVQKKATDIAMFNKEIMDVMKTLPQDFALALKVLMKWKKITVENLAEKSLLSSKTIQRIRNENDYQTTIGAVVAICVAMQLPPVLSRKVLEIAGFTIRYSSEEQMAYEFILTGYYTHSVLECNELLISQGFKELTSKE